LSDLANVDYLARVNRAIDHVVTHLAEPLRLEDVARVACFSPFHFHRIYRAVVGETLHEFVKRVRLERALFVLSRPSPPSLTELALECGFASSSDFSRAFKARYGVAPSRFDLDAHRAAGRTSLEAVTAGHRMARLAIGENPDGFTVTLRDLPARHVAYVRVFKPYAGRGVLDAIERLAAWAESRGLAEGQWLGYQWEDPDIVPLEHCRYDVGLEVPASARPDDGVGLQKFPAMRVAEVAIAGPVDLELRALDWLYSTWLLESGYAPDHQPCFEVWSGRPFAHGMEHFELRVHLAVTREPFES